MVEIIKLRDDCSLLNVNGKEVSFDAIRSMIPMLLDEFDKSVEKIFNIGSASKVVEAFSEFLKVKTLTDDHSDSTPGYSFRNGTGLGSFQLDFSQLNEDYTALLEKKDGEVEVLKELTNLNLMLYLLILIGATPLPLTELRTLAISNTRDQLRNVFYNEDGKFKLVPQSRRNIPIISDYWLKYWTMEKHMPSKVDKRLAYYLLVIRDFEIRLLEGYYEHNIMRLFLDSGRDDVFPKAKKCVSDYNTYLFVTCDGLRNLKNINLFIESNIKKILPDSSLSPRLLVDTLSFYVYELVTLRSKDQIEKIRGSKLPPSWNELSVSD